MQTPNTHDVRRPVAKLAVRVAVTALLALFMPVAAAELPTENDKGWDLRKETDSIQVYTIDQPNSSFQAFKAVAMLDTSIENLMAVMINPKSCVEWVHNCSESYAFGDGDFRDRYAYSINDMPWPVADRDYVLRIRTHGSESEGDIIMDLNAVPQRRDVNEDYVRVDRSDTLYRFTPMGDQTRMVWIQHTEPNGSIPGWLVNSLLVDIPIKSMEELERVARKDRYQNYTLVYDDDGHLTAVVPASSNAQSGDDESEPNS
ncbi:START domain-containing protein [Marinobacter sp. CHS3-4]|uniref:START domain-containing protein n=1 Tax=Marinobacter sp. CHS3-4 TaxID=3045174 RepID=UPI0024B5A4D5|nr:START domain-containing protein [Marinobacter sp. CHS3-4]MDI9246169.1 START domain-containing protein [Marinobacter sp. CHS3-4]